MMLRLWDAERPRAVLVGWDTLDVADLPARGVPRLPVGPRVRRVAARAARPAARGCARRSASPSRRRPATRPTTFSRRPSRAEEERGGTVARRDRRSRRLPAGQRATHDPAADEGRQRDRRASARPRCASATASTPRRCRTSSRCAATRPTSCRARRASARRRPRPLLGRVRHARGGARGRALRRRGRGAASLPAHRDDGRRRRPFRTPRSGARLGAAAPSSCAAGG